MRLKPPTDCDLEEILEGLLQELSWQLSGNVLSVKAPADLRPVRGDHDLIATGLMQLLDNAAKYSVPGSTITITVEEQLQVNVVSVHNWGPVIRAEERERIFERFYRAPGSEHLAAGTGLGLSITRRAAEAHGGRAWVESSSEAGTTFFFSLPSQPAKGADNLLLNPEFENVRQAYEM